MRVHSQHVLPGVLAGVVAYTMACGGPAETPTSTERAAADGGNAEVRGLEEAARIDLIRRVREGPGGPKGAGYARWLEQQLVAAEGTLMFADWHVMPCEKVDEVRFTYTLLDANYRVLTGAYVWEVGHDQGEVGAPRPIRPGTRSAPAGDETRGGSWE